MQILHPVMGSAQEYAEESSKPDRYRLDHCPQCQAQHPLTGHGFYHRTWVDVGFDGSIRVRRYLCRFCKRTVSLLPEFALPYLRFSVSVISLFLTALLLEDGTLKAAAAAPAASFVIRGLHMLKAIGWMRAHRFLFSDLRVHLLRNIDPLIPGHFNYRLDFRFK